MYTKHRILSIALAGLISLSCGRESFTPVEPVDDTRPGHLSLTVTLLCATVSAADVFLDGRKAGEMNIPGSFFVDVPVGLHSFQIGTFSYVIPFSVDHGETAAFENASFKCPATNQGPRQKQRAPNPPSQRTRSASLRSPLNALR